jgi:2-polyprenyl-3-methyl-5-hydroxy-6-metoxy-1,4-benzoquinol methylase
MRAPFDLRQRRREPELMDQPGLDERQHVQALRGLERINRWSGSARILWPPVHALLQQQAPRGVRLLDVATGAGDVPLSLWGKARRAGLPLQVAGCDRSPVAVAHAGRRAEERQVEAHFFECDVLNSPLPDGYDVIVSSLFLHHLDDEEALQLLRTMAQAAGRLVLVNDLRRSAGGLLLAHLGTRLLSRSRVVHTDGPLSVAAAFTPAEALDLTRRAGLTGARVWRRWPFRFLLTWQRP